MAEWAAKRFWTTSTAEPAEAGWAIALDGRAVRTPAKAPLIVPSQALAQAIAAEWDAQDEAIAPDTMPLTRIANSAIDKVTPQKSEVAALIAAYGDNDLLCYRADQPEALAHRQARAWDPMLDWAETALGVRLESRIGLMPVSQDQAVLDRLDAQVAALTAFELAAFHDLVALTGSLVLGFALAKDAVTVDQAWALSTLDERWQEEHWGEDDEALRQRAYKQQSLGEAAQFYNLLQTQAKRFGKSARSGS